MRNIKDIKAEVNTITYDKDKIEEKVGSIYEAIVIMGKRAEQINSEIRTELHNKLDEFAVRDTSLEEVFENREQIEISKYYEKLPNISERQINNFFYFYIYFIKKVVISCELQLFCFYIYLILFQNLKTTWIYQEKKY